VKLHCEPTAAGTASYSLRGFYEEVRAQTERLCRPLAVEDYGVQSMPDASPAKWHLAHTTWFFETFVLAALLDHRPFHPDFGFLFNSYYNAIGQRVPRAQRGLLSRPTVEEVYRYRADVDDRMRQLFDGSSAALAPLIVLGLNHEQQHQELLLTDVHHAFSCNPLRPAYRQRIRPASARSAPGPGWIACPGGMHEIGHAGDGFAYDNEGPRHRVHVESFRLQSALITCGEYLAFMDDGGYRRPELWLSDGWDASRTKGWSAPLYWEQEGNRWRQHTLNGVHPVNPDEPVCHVSFYETDAFARWAGARLPTEAEWEVAAGPCPLIGSFVDADRLYPHRADKPNGLQQMFGEVWQWTASPYVGYPGYRPAEGALGEYNGKFMCNQMVLRGGSCLTPRSHFRRTYRNFFPPDARWQMTGIRLALDGHE
jgi:ergothioneine biosynthesis protein EgtB